MTKSKDLVVAGWLRCLTKEIWICKSVIHSQSATNWLIYESESQLLQMSHLFDNTTQFKVLLERILPITAFLFQATLLHLHWQASSFYPLLTASILESFNYSPLSGIDDMFKQCGNDYNFKLLPCILPLRLGLKPCRCYNYSLSV